MTMPNFIIIGAGKSGTTSLHHYLSAHPDIFMCRPKEPRFFAYVGAPPTFRGPGDERMFCAYDPAHYRELFRCAGSAKAVGEASTWYLSSEHAAENIKKLAPEAKLIAVLRNPVERAFSHWMHLIREQVEPIEDFGEACAAEAERIAAGWSPHWHYVRQSRYHEGLLRFIERFPATQLRIFLYEDLQNDALDVSRQIFGFLGVDDGFTPDTTMKLNVGGTPRLWFLQRYLDSALWGGNDPLRRANRLFPARVRQHVKSNLTRMNLSSKLSFDPGTRSSLCAQLEGDIARLETMIVRDLSHWRSAPAEGSV